MKLIEKLAKEFARTETYCDSVFTAENAYAAGFRKALEVAMDSFHAYNVEDKALIIIKHLYEK